MKSSNLLHLLVAMSMLLFWTCKTKKENKITDKVNTVIKETRFVANPQDVEEFKITTLAINDKAPDFKLPAIDGNFYTLDNFADAKVLVVIFTCNHCPTAQAYEDRIIQLVNDYKDEGVRIIAISPNSVKALLPEELGYSDMGDSYEEMKIRAKNKKYNFLYLYDGDTQETSIKYGPIATPHAFVFDKERILKYAGRLDDSEKPGTANADDLRSTIEAVLLDIEILEPETKTFGCSIKWGWKHNWTDKVNSDWARKPVKLDEIGTEGAKFLMKNDSDKLRLINIWATWCGPCIIEFPEFVNIHRMYIARDFEFISLSTDKLDQKNKTLNFLKNNNSAVQNYIFSDTDIYKLIDVVDSEWRGALPYTVLLEPGGKVIYKKMGIVDPYELKKIIVDHPMIGRYY